MKLFLPGLILASFSAAQTAHGAIVLTLSELGDNGTYTAFNFSEALKPGSFTGLLTAVSVDVTLNASTNYTYADDICVYASPAPLALGGLLQVGGFSNMNATQRFSWANGGSNNPGTRATGTVNLTTAIPFNPGNETMSIWIGNGYGAAGTSGTWSGTVTLVGLERTAAVPEPGSLLLGMSGLVAMASRRVRRRGREANPSSNGEVGTAAS
jgi:hypothetical protein